MNTSNSDNTSRDGRIVGLHHWGRVSRPVSKQATKTDMKNTLGSEGQKAIARAEKAAKARMAQLRTLKTVPQPREGLLERAIRAIFG